MRIIQGTNVDLISPFPISEVRRTYGWNHCYRTLTESDDSPKGMEEFVEWMTYLLSVCPSWGVIDKHHITNIKHEAPLVGIGIFEPQLPLPGRPLRGGCFHVATARKAWRTGLVDEAAKLAIDEIFTEIPTLLRIGGHILERNYPAKALCKRLGFRFEGLLEDVLTQDGNPQNVAIFGLTRRNYVCQCQQVAPMLEQSAPSQEPQAVLLEDSSEVQEAQVPQVEPKM